MGKKKKNVLINKKKLEEKAESGNWKKSRKYRYKQMAIKGILGAEELSKYQEMYSSLKNKVQEFNFLNIYSGDVPRRKDYEELKLLYREYSDFL